MKIVVQQGKAIHAFETDRDAVDLRVEALKDYLESSTGTLKQRQKLIYKGKVLLPFQTFEEAKLEDGSKVMLMATSGPTLGQVTAKQAADDKAQALREKKQREQQQKDRASERQQRQAERAAESAMQARSKAWASTGIVALRESQLKELPPQVWETGAAALVADFQGNRLTVLPAELSSLTGLQKLQLSHNFLSNEGIPVTLFPALHELKVLAIAHNRLNQVPNGITDLQGLKALDLSHNRLERLPEGISSLKELQLLRLEANNLSSLPSSLGKCHSLAALDLSGNVLQLLPEALSGLQELQNLALDQNRLRNIPPAILLGCRMLQTLTLHGNPLTIEQLRETPAFKEFDLRRQSKHSKQMDSKVMLPSSGFDEGADQMEWRHWTS